MKTLLKVAVVVVLFSPAPGFAQAADSVVLVTQGGEVLFRIGSDGGAMFGGAAARYGHDPIAEGAGTRFMWDPQRAALRAGYVSGTQWDGPNIGSYSMAVGEDVSASGDHSVAFGLRSNARARSSFAAGEDNTASGAGSVALGSRAHSNARQGSFVFADRSTADTLRAGVNHSANWRVSGGFRIFTESNLSRGVTIQSGSSVSNWGQSSAVISTSTGALLTTGGVWQNASDVNRKYGFVAVDVDEVLALVAALPISEWSYFDEPGGVRHIGPTAQDFRAAFGLGTSELAIGTVDADGVALTAIQALERRTAEQARTIEGQAARIEALERELAAAADGLRAQEERIQALEEQQEAVRDLLQSITRNESESQ